MKNHAKIFNLFIILAIAFTGARGQTQEFFASGDGGFRINLPPQFTSSKEIKFVEQGLQLIGTEYLWEKENEFFYQIQYMEFLTEKKSLTPALKKSALDSFRKGLASAAERTGAPHTEKPFSFGGNPGAELQINYPFSKIIYRFFIVNKTFYMLGGIVFNLKDEARIRQVLDSFRLLNKQEIIAAKVREATPEPLPQSPPAPKMKSDAEDENLKGRVKTVTEQSVDWKYRNLANKRVTDSETIYDEQGNKIKKTAYNNNVPYEIDVYGYLDKMRVSRNGFIYSEESGVFQTVAIGATKGNEPKKPADERYDSRYEYKYENGFLKEQLRYSNDGDLSQRIVYNRSENKVEELYYNSGTKLTGKYVNLLDAKGNVTEEQGYDENGNKTEYRYSYKYEAFDAQGNWTKRVTLEWKNRALVPTSITYRTITYYP